jgi:hypothetical protein
MVTSPTHPDRHGVIVSCRVLSANELAGLLVTRPRRTLFTRNVNGSPGIHSSTTPESFDRPASSPGVRPPSTAPPDLRARGPKTTSSSPGVCCPFSASGGESPRPDQSLEGVQPGPRRPVRVGGLRRRFPHRRLRRRSRVFSTPQRLALLSAVPSFSDGWRSWGFTLQGLVPPTKTHRLVADGLPS